MHCAGRSGASHRKESYEVVSVFIGGGTPSVLSGEQLCRIMDEIRQAFDLSEDAEITMEANLGTVSLEQMKLCRKASINRISLGLQSTVQQELDMLGRITPMKNFSRVISGCGKQDLTISMWI